MIASCAQSRPFRGAVVVATALLIWACDVNPFELSGPGVGGDGGTGGDGATGDGRDGDGGIPDASGPDACSPVAESCDGVDNDCNGNVDEGFDLTADPGNCGECGKQCTLPGADGSCVNSVCVFECAPTFHDLNLDLGMQGSNGCEYGPCTASATGDEECNFIDDDCDNKLDEEIAGLDSDPLNCGECFKACIFVNVEGVACNAGVCEFAACEDTNNDGTPDFNNIVDPPNGCEYVCPRQFPTDPDGPTPETCDGVDDDCDGATDELPIAGLGAQCYTPPTGCVPDGSGGFNCCNGYAPCLCNAGVQGCNLGVGECLGVVGPQTQEVCDAIDHDCDGNPTNGFDLQTDVNNCSTCGNACANNFDSGIDPHVLSTSCETGTCKIAVCASGFHDNNGIYGDGCEYGPCVATGPESCDGLDNDCNGVPDDGLDPPPSLNCSIPGTLCAGVQPVCSTCGGVTTFRCDYTGVANVETRTCGALAFQETLCDTFDNDCDTNTDETFPVDPSKPASDCDDGEIGDCRDVGKLICDPADNKNVICNATDTVSFPGPAEQCDGLDNDCDGKLDEESPEDIVGIDTDDSGSPNYFIYMYEAVRPDATAFLEGVASHRSCSRPGAIPWSSVTKTEAEAACVGAGMRLCTQDEWKRACQGDDPNRQFPYGFSPALDVYDPNACNGDDFDFDCVAPNDHEELLVTGFDYGCPATTGTCASQDGVFDMSGNLREWTSTPTGAGLFGVRGGSYVNAEIALTCTNDFLSFPAATAFPTLGFRCCADAP